MADYIRINQHNRGGELAISRKVFARIAEEAANNAILSFASGKACVCDDVKVIFHHDGRVKVKVDLSLKKGVKPTDISLEIQKEIAHELEIYVESVPFDIEISVDEIK